MKMVFILSIIFGFSFTAVPLQADEEGKYLYREIPDITIDIPNRNDSSLFGFCKVEPTIISLAYSRCAGICYPFLFSLRDKIQNVGEGQKKYRILILSCDENDTKESMAAMAAVMNLQNNSTWIFGTVDKSQISLLAQSIGFEYAVDSLTGQINHPPIVVGVNKEGTIVRIIRKYDITNAMLWQIYREIQGEFVPLYSENMNILVSCFTYNSQQGTFNFSWGILLLYMPVGFGAVIVWRIFSVRNRMKAIG